MTPSPQAVQASKQERERAILAQGRECSRSEPVLTGSPTAQPRGESVFARALRGEAIVLTGTIVGLRVSIAKVRRGDIGENKAHP